MHGAEAADHPSNELELLTVAKLVMLPLNCNSAEAAKAMSRCQYSCSRLHTLANSCGSMAEAEDLELLTIASRAAVCATHKANQQEADLTLQRGCTTRLCIVHNNNLQQNK